MIKGHKYINVIIIHVLAWMIVFAIGLSQVYYQIEFIPSNVYVFWFTILFLFYFNYFILVPKLLLKHKILIYVAIVLSISISVYFVSRELRPDRIIENFRPNLLSDRLLVERKLPPFFVRFSKLITILLFFAIGTSIRLALEWYKNEKQKVLMQSEKVNTELSFLKAQLNPHFLFNSLNSIYALANKKSDDTSEAIITLSELMRYMIYETDRALVPLEDELNYIKNYISLQTLRIKDSIGVRFNMHGSLDHKIEPLLLISFIENAFKYGTDFTGKTDIRIKMTVEGEHLIFEVINHISSLRKKNEHNSGVGLHNIKNRLNLLYPNNHELIITDENNHFRVFLTLKLKRK
ncbi:sensor histidine kinase [Aureibaculum sp. A20]|uniref:Sensor histidine kinase n=1 Tax=Aureibaculum flavum TaxID=2795986 RepID=A0ABS0WL63_9FLAO|nr:sensor histidine kinase [Aureibaculum flavum]MBJ2172710.1 sensor histidine kinase [Aureibaculum flavum]